MKRTALLILIISIFAAVVVIGGVSAYLVAISPKNGGAETRFTVLVGDGVKTIAARLSEQRLIRNSFAFQLYVWAQRNSGALKAGEYDLASSMSVSDIVAKLTGGDIIANDQKITILEGWTSEEIASYLAGQGLQTTTIWEQALAVTDSREILPDASYPLLKDKPAGATLEGYCFPDTYRVFKNATPAEVIKKMLDNAEQKITASMRQSIEEQGRTVFDVLTLASILEREVGSEKDMRLAADVFLKRIRDGMPLQSDATVNYITKKGTPRPSADDISIDSPYNTYKVKGLPPGPIGNPGLSAIQAAINPEPNDYYYFITTTDGEAVFGRTFEEHAQNIAKYLE